MADEKKCGKKKKCCSNPDKDCECDDGGGCASDKDKDCDDCDKE